MGWMDCLVLDQDVIGTIGEEQIRRGCGCLSRKRPRGDIPNLHSKFRDEKDRILLMRQTNFDFKNTMHYRMLRTIYSKLTRNKVCPRAGKHWEDMGFQSSNPLSDINRCGGVLNIVHLFCFFEEHFEVLKAIYHLSKDEQQFSPLALLSINMTYLVMEAFIAGHLSAYCNRGKQSLFGAVCLLHAAGLFHFYSQWRHLKRTIMDTASGLKEVESFLNKNPGKLVAMFQNGLQEHDRWVDKIAFTDLSEIGTQPSITNKVGTMRGTRIAPVPKRWKDYAKCDVSG